MPALALREMMSQMAWPVDSLPVPHCEPHECECSASPRPARAITHRCGAGDMRPQWSGDGLALKESVFERAVRAARGNLSPADRCVDVLHEVGQRVDREEVGRLGSVEHAAATNRHEAVELAFAAS
jgi:hypothetical protein